MMGYGGYGIMRYGGYGMMGYGGGWMMMFGVLIVIILVAVVMVRYFQHTNQVDIHSSNGSAIRILDERYAKSEITDEEYKKIKAEIKN